MCKKERFIWICLLIVCSAAMYYVAPYIKGAPDYTAFIGVGNDKEEIPISQMDKQAHIAVIINDASVIKDESQHIDWARRLKELDWEYKKIERHLGHTAVVFKPVAQEPKTPSH